MRASKRVLVRVALAGLVVLAAAQLVPYPRPGSNPPVRQDAPWPTASAEELGRRACYACHSNETTWPPYAYVAPMSWLVRSDVERGRDALNFSDWDRHDGEADDAVEAIVAGSMPPTRFTLLHPEARLDDAEVEVLVSALAAMERDR